MNDKVSKGVSCLVFVVCDVGTDICGGESREFTHLLILVFEFQIVM